VTPPDVCAWIERIARALAEIGWTVRTGWAEGADAAFSVGAGRDRRALFVPNAHFGGWPEVQHVGATRPALNLAAQHHPRWPAVSHFGRALLARTSHVILGPGLDTPVAFVLCWTSTRDLTAADTLRPTSKAGGTGQAIRIADAHRIPIWNLAVAEHAAIWKELTA
jgi:hypothetical protein